MKNILVLIILFVSISIYSQDHYIVNINKDSKTVSIGENNPKTLKEPHYSGFNKYEFKKMVKFNFVTQKVAFQDPKTKKCYKLIYLFVNSNRRSEDMNYDIYVYQCVDKSLEKNKNQLIHYVNQKQL